MKKQIILLTVCAVMVFGFAINAMANNQNFTLVNETGVTVDELYISKVSTNDWEEDILGVDSLGDGEQVEVEFPVEEDACKWDIMIKDTDGNEFFWRGIDLCEVEKITLHYENGKAWATTE